MITLEEIARQLRVLTEEVFKDAPWLAWAQGKNCTLNVTPVVPRDQIIVVNSRLLDDGRTHSVAMHPEMYRMVREISNGPFGPISDQELAKVLAYQAAIQRAKNTPFRSLLAADNEKS